MIGDIKLLFKNATRHDRHNIERHLKKKTKSDMIFLLVLLAKK